MDIKVNLVWIHNFQNGPFGQLTNEAGMSDRGNADSSFGLMSDGKFVQSPECSFLNVIQKFFD